MRMYKRILMNIKSIFLEECWRLKHPNSIFKKGNSKFFLPDRRDFIQQKIISSKKFYEEEKLKELEKYIEKDFVYLDIGANIGHHTVYFYKELGAKKVYAFEPHKYLNKIINKSLEINKITNAKVYHVAVGNDNKKAKLFTPKFKPFLRKNFAVAQIDNNKGQQDVDMIRIDDLNFTEKINIIKMDTEGFEVEVLKGAEKLINKDRPLVWVEIKEQNQEFVEDFFKKKNYNKVKIIKEDHFFIPR